MCRRFWWLALAAILTGCHGNAAKPVPGTWHAWLDSPGGELPFELVLSSSGDGSLEAELVNGPERLSVERVALEQGELLLRIDHYDSEIRAAVEAHGRTLTGSWQKTSGPGTRSELAFHAVAGETPRFAGATGAAEEIAGRWLVAFDREPDPAVAVFRAENDGSVGGTFLTTTGDYRYLAGGFDGERLRLSVFDGAHAFLFDARLQADGTLAGDFWSRDTWHDRWTARRDPEARISDPFAVTTWVTGTDLVSLVYPDLDGVPRSLDEFDGRARLLYVFGSWCPNCNDATSYLVELHRRYARRGLSIVGLAFELTGDLERDGAQLRRYAEHHGIEYPLLIAGVSDKLEASTAFPLVDRVRAFPTTLFLDGDDRVVSIHTGFSGPATGELHEQLRVAFEKRIENLLESGGVGI